MPSESAASESAIAADCVPASQRRLYHRLSAPLLLRCGSAGTPSAAVRRSQQRPSQPSQLPAAASHSLTARSSAGTPSAYTARGRSRVRSRVLVVCSVATAAPARRPPPSRRACPRYCRAHVTAPRHRASSLVHTRTVIHARHPRAHAPRHRTSSAVHTRIPHVYIYICVYVYLSMYIDAHHVCCK
jgi:hypothetical protein